MPRDGWDVAQLVGCMPSTHVILNLIPSTTQTRHGGGMSITSSLRRLRDRSQVQSCSLLHNEFEVSLGYIRPCPLPAKEKMTREKAGGVMAAIRGGRRLCQVISMETEITKLTGIPHVSGHPQSFKSAHLLPAL